MQTTAVQSAAVAQPVCRHKWASCLTPPDSARRWVRCSTCSVFGFVRNLTTVPYLCSEKGCGLPAVERLPGRGPRSSYLWHCRGHLAASAVPAEAP